MANGAVQLIDGALLLSQKTLHATRDKTKGIAKVLSGATGIALSYTPWLAQFGVAGLTSATALAAPAYALTQLVDLTCNAIDYHYARKELKLSGWLDERSKEIKKLDNEIENLDKKIEKRTFDEKSAKLILKQDELREKKNKLEDDIRARIFCATNGTEDEKKKFEKSLLKNPKLQKLCQHYQPKDVPLETQNNYRNRNEEIKTAVKKQAKAKAKNLAIKAFAFSGALLLAISPFTGPAAPALFGIGLAISMGVGLYSAGRLAKQNERINRLATEVKGKLTQAFFPEKPKEQELMPLASMNTTNLKA
jgi:hypothetical protein